MFKELSVIILNDTRREGKHVGCVKVMNNIYQACEKNGLKIVDSFKETNAYRLNSFFEGLVKADAVLLNGEGTFHDDQESAIDLLICCMIAKHVYKKTVVLFNAVWAKNELLNRYLYVFDLIYTRESLSQNEIISAGGDVRAVVPDMTFYSGPKPRNKKQNKLIITDSVLPRINNKLLRLAIKNKVFIRVMGSKLDIWPQKRIWRLIKALNLIPQKTLSEKDIENANYVITGRFHAMCLSMMYGVPFRVIASNTPKVEGTLKDVGLELKYFMIDPNEEIDFLLNVMNDHEATKKIETYVKEAGVRIDKMFKEIKVLIESKKSGEE